MDPVRLGIVAGLVPAAVAAAAFLVLRRTLPGRAHAAAGALAAFLGFAAGWIGVAGPPAVPPSQMRDWVFVVATIAAVVCTALRTRTDAAPAAPAGPPLTVALVVATTASVAIGLSGTETIAALTGALAASVGAVLALVLLLRAAAPGAACFAGFVTAALLLFAYRYAELPPAAGLLVAAGAAAGWAPVVRRPAVRIALAVALAGAGVGVAVANFEPSPY